MSEPAKPFANAPRVESRDVLGRLVGIGGQAGAFPPKPAAAFVVAQQLGLSIGCGTAVEALAVYARIEKKPEKWSGVYVRLDLAQVLPPTGLTGVPVATPDVAAVLDFLSQLVTTIESDAASATAAEGDAGVLVAAAGWLRALCVQMYASALQHESEKARDPDPSP
jgi:hypothetical protein